MESEVLNMSEISNTPIQAYKSYQWIVWHADLLGGKPTIRGTRLSVALILECLAAGMDAEEINETYGGFPKDAIPEVLKLASEQLNKPIDPSDVAA
jgi:uncharacterized protein (DUF433 family)